MFQNDNLSPEMAHSADTGRAAYEVRVDGIVVAKGPKIEEVLRIALDRKQRLPQQIIGLHETTFNRAWTIDQFGRVVSATD